MVKIQINSREALERLIGEDAELEIEVKRAVINGFAKNYLKSIANSEVMASLKEAVVGELKDEFDRTVEKSTLWECATYKAKPELKKAIQNEVNKAVYDLIGDAVREQIKSIQEEEARNRVRLAAESAVAIVSAGNIDRFVQRKLNQALNGYEANKQHV